MTGRRAHSQTPWSAADDSVLIADWLRHTPPGVTAARLDRTIISLVGRRQRLAALGRLPSRKGWKQSLRRCDRLLVDDDELFPPRHEMHIETLAALGGFTLANQWGYAPKSYTQAGDKSSHRSSGKAFAEACGSGGYTTR